ncbi:MAG: glycosyltransferase [Candidatus Limivivens sp.]|nr:glycosyltransferase [Candidatus Limivivens sp.]
MPKVSIIVPTYNVAQYLDQCMTSLINQTLKDIEMICINDGSTDNSLEILKRYAASDSRIKIIDKENGGYGIGMNIGLDHCTGEYVGIVEPDDYVKLNMYEDLYNLAKQHDVDIIKADFYRFVHDKNEKQVDIYNALYGDQGIYNRVIDPAEEPIVFKCIMNTWSGIYKRSFLLEHGIRHHETPGASFQDNGFWFKTFCYAKRIYFVNKPYYMNRRDNPNSSVHNPAKVYCMNDEYAYIHDFLDEHPEFKERYIGMYSFKRFHNYVASYYRIGDEFKEEYLERFQKEFQEAMEAGELREEIFTESEWEMIQILVRNAEAFKYAEQLHRCKIEKGREISRLKKELRDVKTSTTFKVGKAVMFLPCRLKEMLKSQ